MSEAGAAADRPRPILVTGATGTHGGSGRAVVEELLRRGLPVRAMARRRDERSEALAECGADVVIGDFADVTTLSEAVDGIRTAYFCYPVGAGIVEAAGLFSEAGRAQGLERVVDLSLAASKADSPAPQGRAQFVAERIFEWAGFSGVHLRIASFFMENVLLMDAPGVRRAGRIANAFGDLSLGWISGADVGAMAAALLADPDLTRERVLIAGAAERLTYSEIAATIAAVTGKPVGYEELSPDAWRTELIAASSAKGEPNVRGADHMVAQAVALRSRPPMPIANHVRRLTGREPIAFRAFVEAHQTDLMPPS